MIAHYWGWCCSIALWTTEALKRKGMLRNSFLTASLFILFSASLAHAQLGPRDSANLRPTDLERVKVDDMAPDFTLENMDGKIITLSDFRGKKNVVLIFYRGYW